MTGTTVFTNAVVHSMVPGESPHRSLAHAGGTIVAVGSERDVIAAAGAQATLEDLGGRAVVPGFIDPHHHFLSAIIEGNALDVSVGAARSIAALKEILQAHHRRWPKSAWLLAVGYDELALQDRRHPVRGDLDDACPGRPVLLVHYSVHEAVASSRALQLAGIDRHTPDPPAGMIDRGRRGVPTGRLIEAAFSRAYQLAVADLLARDPEAVSGRLFDYEEQLFRVGITRVGDPGVPPAHEAIYRRALERGSLRMPILMLPASAEGLLCPPYDRLAGPRTGEGPEHLRVGPLKLFFDGANRCAMRLSIAQAAGTAARMIGRAIASRSLAAFRGANDMGPRLGGDFAVRTGMQLLSLAEGQWLAKEACARGFSIAIHAIGNVAVDQAIDTLAQVRALHPETPPPRIEHACFVTPEAARRASDAGIAVVSQPAFVALPTFHELPIPHGLRLLAHRTLIEAGVRVAGSSDAPVTDLDPLVAMRRAVDRRSIRGRPLQVDEAISPGQALAMYTREAAYVSGCLEQTGTLEPGKRADIVVLSCDPLVALEDTAVERTIVAGRVMYQARGG
jgi:hypothetical protein